MNAEDEGGRGALVLVVFVVAVAVAIETRTALLELGFDGTTSTAATLGLAALVYAVYRYRTGDR